MRTSVAFLAASVLLATLPAFAQRPEERGGGQRQGEQRGPEQHGEREPNAPRANQGHIPAPPPHRDAHAAPEPERKEGGRVNSVPHVNNDHWYGHDKPNDKRYHIDHPFEHGHFEHFGANYRYRVERFDRDRHIFWLPGGFSFQIASWDWALAADWCWDCGDDYVVYEDTDHVGWYLLYNVHTGAYVHVMYMGM
jgi:hypothetical protein